MTRQQLIENIRRKGSFLCVGLDPDLRKMPELLLRESDPVYAFNRAIIDATEPYAVAYKPNVAFYEALGVEGIMALEKTIAYLRQRHPDAFVILDAKRGDIGNTAAMYAHSAFKHLDADAVTVAPYMGSDSVTPFLEYDGRWVVLLALTSNKGSLDFQMTTDGEGTPLWQRVIATSQQWAGDDKMMYVVGATRGSLLAEVRQVAPTSFLLVPGVGAQGGSLEDVCRHAMTDECCLLVNSSRGIIYASDGDDFAQAAAEAAATLASQMKALLPASMR